MHSSIEERIERLLDRLETSSDPQEIQLVQSKIDYLSSLK